MIAAVFAHAVDAVTCPRCGSSPGARCLERRHPLGTLHAERLAAFYAAIGRPRMFSRRATLLETLRAFNSVVVRGRRLERPKGFYRYDKA